MWGFHRDQRIVNASKQVLLKDVLTSFTSHFFPLYFSGLFVVLSSPWPFLWGLSIENFFSFSFGPVVNVHSGPEPPSDLVFSDVTDSSFTVSWAKPKSKVSGFKITHTHVQEGNANFSFKRVLEAQFLLETHVAFIHCQLVSHSPIIAGFSYNIDFDLSLVINIS